VSVQNLLFGLLGRAQPTGEAAGSGERAATAAPDFVVPITVRPLEAETMLPNPKRCPALAKRWDEVRAATSAEEKGTPDEALLLFASEELGYGAGEFRLDQAREVLVCARAYGDSLPEQMTDEVLLKLMRLNAQRWFIRFADPIVARLGMGLLVHEIQARLDMAASAGASADADSDASSGLAVPRCVLYSGHDSTLVPLLAALGITRPHEWPQYAGSISVELAELPALPGGLGCRLLYDDAPMPLPQAIAEATGTMAASSALGALPPDLVEAGWVPWEGVGGFRAHLARVAVSPEQWRVECDKGGVAAEGGGEDRSLSDTLTGDKIRKPKAKL